MRRRGGSRVLARGRAKSQGWSCVSDVILSSEGYSVLSPSLNLDGLPSASALVKINCGYLLYQVIIHAITGVGVCFDRQSVRKTCFIDVVHISNAN